MRILSGIQPSGTLHIGNFLGMIQPMVQSQEENELFCFLANLHSLTSVFDPKQLQTYTNEAIIDLLALGISPDKSVFWVQSDVPEVTELTWYLNNVTPKGLLERCHSYKDKIAKGLPASNGLFSYPVLMAADILMYQTNVVPVGKDQKQHVEVARDIAIKFNQTYGNVFTVPEPRIREEVAVIPGIDGQKMSKSYGNTIDIFAPENQLRKKDHEYRHRPHAARTAQGSGQERGVRRVQALCRTGKNIGNGTAASKRRVRIRGRQEGIVLCPLGIFSAFQKKTRTAGRQSRLC